MKCLICEGLTEFKGEGDTEEEKLVDMRKKTAAHLLENHPSVVFNFCLEKKVIE